MEAQYLAAEQMFTPRVKISTVQTARRRPLTHSYKVVTAEYGTGATATNGDNLPKEMTMELSPPTPSTSFTDTKYLKTAT